MKMAKAKKGLPTWLSWVVRIVVYGFALLILLLFAYFYVNNHLAGNVEKCESETHARTNMKISALKNIQNLLACIERENNFVENWVLHDTFNTLRALPNAPCNFVGVWESEQPQCRYTITLQENGEFKATPIACNISMSAYSGTWGVYENKMAWLDSRNFRWPVDINGIEAVEKNSFSLIEMNGARTQFTRLEAPSAATGCVKPVALPPSVTTVGNEEVKPALVEVPVVVAQSVVASKPAPVVVNEPIKPEVTQVVAPVVSVVTTSSVKKRLHTRRKQTDLRYCLERSSNYEIAKCATEPD